MNYILFNADGSVNTQHLDYYIMQGSTGVNEIFVSIADTLITNTTIALFSLPNQTTSTQAGVYQADYEYAEGLTANGWLITLTSTETLYNGLLRMSVLVYTGTTLLLTTYPIALVINETGYRPDADTGVTIEEINTYLQQLQSYALLADVEDRFLPLIGGTMSGAILQPVAPLVDYDLANKKYVDDEVKVATDDIADIIDGDLTVHTAYHAEMDVYGNLIPTYYQPKLTFDAIPTASSVKPVTSGGIKTYVDDNVAEIGVIGGSYSSLLNLVNSENSVNGVLNVSRYGQGVYKPVYMLKWGNEALTIESGAIKLFQQSGGAWVLVGTYAKESETGYSFSLNPTTYVLTLKNKAGGTLSSVDLPLESVVVSGSYDEATQSIILTLQNGTEITIPVADLVDGLVPNTRTIAGVDLADDIPASELNTALGIAKTDIVVNTADYVSLELDSKPVQVQSAIEDKNGADITATYAKMISGTTFAGYVASPSISHSGYYVINDDTSLIYLKGSLYSLTSAGVVTLISSTSESWYGSQEEYDDIAVKNPNTMYYIEEA